MAIEYPIKLKFFKERGSDTGTAGGNTKADKEQKKQTKGIMGMLPLLGKIGMLLAAVAPFIKMIGDVLQFSLALVVFLLKKVVASIVEFFTGGGIGRLWEAVKERFNAALEWLREKLFSLWDNYIRPAWEWLKGVGLWIWNTFIKPAWEFLKSVVIGIWENILKPAWERFKSIVMWIWESILKPAWDRFKAFIQFIWESILKPAWEWIKTKFIEIWTKIIKPVWDWIKAKFESIWNDIVKPTWVWLKEKFTSIWDTYLKPPFDTIKAALQKVGEWVSRIASPVRRVGGAIGSALGINRSNVTQGSDGIWRARAFGGVVPEDGLYKLHAGEQVGRGNTVGNTQSNNIVLNISGGGFDQSMLDKVVRGIGDEMRKYNRW